MDRVSAFRVQYDAYVLLNRMRSAKQKSEAINAINKLVTDGRSATDGIFRDLDPEGDVILTLTPSYPLSLTAENVRAESQLCDTPHANETEKNKKRGSHEANGENYGLVAIKKRGTIPEGESKSGSGDSVDSISSYLPKTELKQDQADELTRMRVSSKHLALASPVFKAMLSDKFKEGQELSSQGSVEIQLPDDPTVAMVLLLYLVHGQHKKVPLSIDLWILIDVVTVADKYSLLDVTVPFQDCWIGNLRDKIPEHLNYALLPWMSISDKFNEAEIFTRVTKIAQLESDGPLETYDLPIPQSILDKIQNARSMTITKTLEFLFMNLPRYGGPTRVCPNKSIECDSATLGSLVIGLKSLKLFPIRPEEGYSIQKLFQQLRDINIVNLCSAQCHGCGDCSHLVKVSLCKGLKHELVGKLNELEKDIQGLQIEGRE